MVVGLNVLKHISYVLWTPYASNKMMKQMVDTMTHICSINVQNLTTLLISYYSWKNDKVLGYVW